jgi:hypothetical protein
MARANLTVTSELHESFVAAQEETSVVRALKIRIAEEDLVLASVADAAGGAEEDFNTVLVGLLGATEASMVLFCSSDISSRGKRWILVSWIPDGCKVRDKMLYASSREDLKRTLGIGYFTSEYAANLLTDVTWDAYQLYIRKDLDKDSLMTESERLMKEENELARVESVSTKSTAMVKNTCLAYCSDIICGAFQGVIPFGLGEGVVEAFKSFIDGSFNWVEFSVSAEVIRLEQSKTVTISDNMQALVNADDAR